ncbi:MAG: enoyl-CoA hydratase/isomerase family protein [Deltaproteobacteria bacterium]|nr:enoyl-CoA hydratase/isomerase family protein [Deltaproteobacteria bacterium]MBW2445199.1 enoyl-CoA hydratase/isomerase family protein [Deltaproteobacteria bacterium]
MLRSDSEAKLIEQGDLVSDDGSYKHIIFAVEDGVATITLNRPDRMNAFTFPLGAELERAYARCDEDDAVRAVILTGAGKAFCAGADLGGGGKTFDDVEGGRSGARSGARARRLQAWQVRKPVVAAINGHAVGVGLTLAMQCDLRIVAREAKLAFAFVRRGIIPELGSHAILPRVIGFSRAADLLLSGRTFRGEEAAALGVASEALPAEEVLPRAQEWAADVAANAAPASVAIAKRLLWESVTETPAETMAKEGPLLAWIGKQPDAAEGVRSFLERRPPEWKLSASTDLPDWPGKDEG